MLLESFQKLPSRVKLQVWTFLSTNKLQVRNPKISSPFPFISTLSFSLSSLFLPDFSLLCLPPATTIYTEVLPRGLAMSCHHHMSDICARPRVRLHDPVPNAHACPVQPVLPRTHWLSLWPWDPGIGGTLIAIENKIQLVLIYTTRPECL